MEKFFGRINWLLFTAKGNEMQNVVGCARKFQTICMEGQEGTKSCPDQVDYCIPFCMRESGGCMILLHVGIYR